MATKSLFYPRMENGTPDPRSPVEVRYEQKAARVQMQLGDFESVSRFVRKYGRVRTRYTVLQAISFYLRWLRGAKGVVLSPDELISDNLRAVYESGPTDATAKRRQH
jgi:hypothetical protein